MASRILSKSVRQFSLVLGQHLVKQSRPAAATIVKTSQRTLLTSPHLRASSEVSNKLTSFLSEEIKLETDSRKNKAHNPKINGFDVKTEGPIVTLTKTHGGDEHISITFNVNGSLDDEQSFDQAANERAENQPEPEVRIS